MSELYVVGGGYDGTGRRLVPGASADPDVNQRDWSAADFGPADYAQPWEVEAAVDDVADGTQTAPPTVAGGA
jgi:hypothetical protein